VGWEYIVKEKHALKEQCFDGFNVKVVTGVVCDLIGKAIVQVHCFSCFFAVGAVRVGMTVYCICHCYEKDAEEGDVNGLGGGCVPHFMVRLVKNWAERGMTDIRAREEDSEEFVDEFLPGEVGEEFVFGVRAGFGVGLAWEGRLARG